MKLGLVKLGILLFILASGPVFAAVESYVSTPPSPVLSYAGVFGNPAGLSYNDDRSTTLGFSIRDKENLSMLRLGLQGKGWGLGYQYNEMLSESVYRLALSKLIAKNIALGSKITYSANEGQNYFLSDLGAEWEMHRSLKLGYHASGLFRGSNGGFKGQTMGVGLRPLSLFVPWGYRLTGIYTIRSAGFSNNPFEDGTHTVFGDLQILSWLHLQGNLDVVNGSHWAAGAYVQILPNQIFGMSQHRTNLWEYTNRVHLANKKEYLIPPGKIALLNLNRTIIEGRINDSWFSDEGETGHLNILEQIEGLDLPGIRALIVKCGSMHTSPAIAAEIRDALEKFRGKRNIKIIAYLETISRQNYYLACMADKIAVAPSGYFDVRGIAVEVPFYKGLLDKVGVEAQFVKHGKYKSYPEVFTSEEMSQYWEENLRSNIMSGWTEFLKAIHKGRGLSLDSLQTAMNTPSISLEKAGKLGLIDTMLYEDQLTEYALGRKTRIYRPAAHRVITPDWSRGASIAVIYIDGTIMPGTSREGGLFSGKTSGSETVVKFLKNARLNPFIKGLVLRLDSPGGSAVASDIIARELELFKKEGKPLIASIGGTCASGCYYLAALADKIYAADNSIVGSIGIFGGKFVAKGLFDKIGVQKKTITSNAHADAHSTYRKWDSTEVSAIGEYMEEFYSRFANLVQTNRQISDEQIEAVAEGRVFTGRQAVGNKLIDAIGGIEPAMGEAKKRLGLKFGPVQWVYLNGNYSRSLWGALKQDNTPSLLKEYQLLTKELQSTVIWALSPEALFQSGGGMIF